MACLALFSTYAQADATLTIRLQTTPADGTNFNFVSTIPAASFFSLDDAATDDGDGVPASAAFQVGAGSYTIIQSAASGWDLDGIDCTTSDPGTAVIVNGSLLFVTASDGETIDCTFRNTRRGSITVTHSAVEKDGTDFSFTLGGAASATITLDDAVPDDGDAVGASTTTSLPPGPYTLTEIVPSGWNLTDLVCTTSDAAEPVVVAPNLATIALDAGESVACTFSNARQRTNVTLRVANDPPDGTDFSFISTLPDLTFFTLDHAVPDDGDAAGASLVTKPLPGTYTVIQNGPPGWTLLSVDCVRSDPAATLIVNGNLLFFNGTGNHSVDCTFRNVITAAPTATMSSPTPDPTGVSPIPVTVQFNKSVVNFAATDIVPGNATIANFVAVDGDTYTFDLVPLGAGVVTATIDAGVAQDALGNPNLAVAPFARTYDPVAPDTTILTSPPNPSTSGSAAFGFSGVDPVGGGVASFECSLDGAAFSACTSPASHAGLADGPHTFAVRAIDTAGNVDPSPATRAWTIDATPPALLSFTRRSPVSSPTSADVLVFRATFSEPVQGVSTADFAVNGGTTATVTQVAPVAPGVVDVTVAGGDLATFQGTVGLDLAPGQDIVDLVSLALATQEPPIDEVYVLVRAVAVPVPVGGSAMLVTLASILAALAAAWRVRAAGEFTRRRVGARSRATTRCPTAHGRRTTSARQEPPRSSTPCGSCASAPGPR